MNHPAGCELPDLRRSTRRARLSLPLTFVILVSLVAGSTLAAAPRDSAGMQIETPPLQQQKGTAVALFAVFLDEPARLAQLEASDLLLYSHLSSIHGDYLLVGAAPEAASRSGVPLRLLDKDTTGASYYLAYPRTRSEAVPWADYGRVLLDLGDQVLLRTSPELAERLPIGVSRSLISRCSRSPGLYSKSSLRPC